VDVFRLVFPKGAGPSVDLQCGTITMDGQTFNVESTEALWYVAILIQAGGAWMTEREIWHAEPRLNGVRTGVRLRELQKRLPPIVRERIETSKHRRRWNKAIHGAVNTRSWRSPARTLGPWTQTPASLYSASL
jgi:hypothetical protein